MREDVDYFVEPLLPQTRCLHLLYFYVPLVLATAHPDAARWCYARSLHQLALYVLERRAHWQWRLLGARPPAEQVLAAQVLHRLTQRLRARSQAPAGSTQREAAHWHYTKYYLQRVLPLTERLLEEEESQAGARVVWP